MLFDTHAHFDTFEKEGTVGDVLRRAAEAGVSRMCAVGSSEASNERVVRLAKQHPDLLIAAVGYDRDQLDHPRNMERLGELAAEPCVAAVGEIGLDYYYSTETAAEQRDLFAGQLAFAADRRLPVIVHSRDAEADTLRLLAEFSMVWKKSFHTMEKSGEKFPYHGKNGEEVSTPWNPLLPPPGVLHCFTGDLDFAGALMDLGFLISFSGILTFNNADPLRAVAREIPEDRLLIETDCPYLTPKPFRGKVNEPAYVTRVAAMLAEVRGTSEEAIAAATFANANRLFRQGENV